MRQLLQIKFSTKHFGEAKGKGAVVTPCAGWLVVCTIAQHIRYRVLGYLFPAFEFNGNAECIAYRYAK